MKIINSITGLISLLSLVNAQICLLDGAGCQLANENQGVCIEQQCVEGCPLVNEVDVCPEGAVNGANVNSPSCDFLACRCYDASDQSYQEVGSLSNGATAVPFNSNEEGTCQ
jgi:hypothetical protein